MSQTRARILAAATEVMRDHGLAALTFDAVAARLGLTKQAVIYWFRTKTQLLAGVALSCLRAEAEVASAAALAAQSPARARGDVVRALIGFHLADLPRFRLMYAAPQTSADAAWAQDMLDQVHGVTAGMYSAIATALGGDDADRRKQAVALHMAALGHVLLVGLTEAVGDPLRHGPDPLARTLADLLTGTGH